MTDRNVRPTGIELKRKRIMILGAGVFQLAAITRAVKLGYEVITMDDDSRLAPAPNLPGRSSFGLWSNPIVAK